MGGEHNNKEFQKTLRELETRSISVAQDELDRKERLDLTRHLNEVKSMLQEFGDDSD